MLLTPVFDFQIVSCFYNSKKKEYKKRLLVKIWPPFLKQNYNVVLLVKNFTIEPCSSFAVTTNFCYEWRDSIT